MSRDTVRLGRIAGNEMMSHPRPVALVTGGARRVGRAVCLALARTGCDVVLTFNRSAMDAERAAAEIREIGARAEVVELRLDDAAALKEAASRIATLSPRWDVLVHNASAYEPSPLAGLTAGHALRDYTINALAPLLLSRALVPALARSPLPGGGAIVAMADIHAMGEHGLPRKNFVSYAMSKAALVEMTRSRRANWPRASGSTPARRAWWPGPRPGTNPMSPRNVSTWHASHLGAGTPEDAAEAVRWLALDAHYVTGQVLRLDGGRSML